MRGRWNQGLPIGLARSRRFGSRGFTLIELCAVVLIITVFAAVALPTAVTQLRDRRVQEAARRFGMVYREARMRALGRGSAVLVRIVGGTMTVLEAQVGVAIDGDVGCTALPVSSCLNTDWNAVTARRVVDGFSVAASGEFSNLTVAMSDSQDNSVPNLDICFTPMGRAFERRAVVTGTPFTPIANAYVATLSRPGSARPRQVVLMPNGSARLFTP